MPGVQDKWWARERNGVSSEENLWELRMQIFKVNVPSKHKNTMCESNGEMFLFGGDCLKQRYFCWLTIVLRVQYWQKETTVKAMTRIYFTQFNLKYWAPFLINIADCIINYIYHHYVTPSTRISLTLSRHPSLSFIASGRFSRLHPVSAHSCLCRFLLIVLPLLVHVKGSTGVCHLWVRPYFSSIVPHVWFV